MQRLYITDLDGTLLNKKGRLTKENKEALNHLIGNGVNITIATARSFKDTKKILRGVHLKLPIIVFNGSYIFDFKNERYYEKYPIIEERKEIFQYMKEIGAIVHIEEENGNNLYHYGANRIGIKRYSDNIEVLPKCKYDLMDKCIMSFTTIGTEKEIKKIKEELSQFKTITIDMWEELYDKPYYWLSVHSKISTKANAAKEIMKMLEVKELFVFGDNNNDLDLFKIAKRSFAVKNAVDSLKENATDIILSNDTNSVVNTIYFLENNL